MQEIMKIRARGQLYTWLSLAFYKPEEDLFTEYFAQGIASALGILQYGMQKEAGTLADWLLSGEGSLQELMVEYSRLFVGPAALPAPPYGSCYLEGGRVMGVTTLEVEREYARQGMMVLPNFKDLPDHIAVEMSFLSHLCDFELECLEKGREEQRDGYRQVQREFLQRHPLAWVHPFIEAVRGNTLHPFYLNASSILRQVLVKEDGILAPVRPC